ncbi:MAG: hypothetical protein ACI841_004202 [Planctomycetota bacterium]|jgi:hypothetical protein
MVNDDSHNQDPNSEPNEGTPKRFEDSGSNDQASNEPTPPEASEVSGLEVWENDDLSPQEMSVAEAADFLGLDTELSDKPSEPVETPEAFADSVSSWLFEDDSTRDRAIDPRGEAPVEAALAPQLPTQSIEGSWLMNPELEDPTGGQVSATPPAPAQPVDPTPSMHVEPQGAASPAMPAYTEQTLDHEPVEAQEPKAEFEASEAAAQGSEHWLMDLDESQDDGTRPLGPAGDVDDVQYAGLDASYHEEPPKADAIKSLAPKMIMAACAGVLVVAGIKFTQGFGAGNFEPITSGPVVVERSMQRKADELQALTNGERAALNRESSSRTSAVESARDPRTNLDPAKNSMSRMRDPWIRQGGRAHKEPGELESFATGETPVAGAAGAAVIYIFPPPLPIQESLSTLFQLNSLIGGGRAAVTGEDLKVALADFPRPERDTPVREPIAQVKAPLVAPNISGEAGYEPEIARWMGPVWGGYLAIMKQGLEETCIERDLTLGQSLAKAPNAEQFRNFGERYENPNASFLALGIVSSPRFVVRERRREAIASGELVPNANFTTGYEVADNAWYGEFERLGSPTEAELADTGEEPIVETPTSAIDPNSALAALARDHGFELAYLESMNDLEAELYSLLSFDSEDVVDFPAREIQSSAGSQLATVVIDGGEWFSPSSDVGPPLQGAPGRGALMARMLPLERHPLDQYIEWRREGVMHDPLFEYVSSIGYTTALPPSPEVPFTEATIDTAPTYVSSLGPWPAGALIIEPAVEPMAVAVVEPAPTTEPPLPKGAFGMPKLSPSTLRRVDPRDRWMEETIPHHAIAAAAPLKTPLVGRVRAVFQSGEVLVGRLWAVGQERIWVETKLGRLSLEASDVLRLERMVGEGVGDVNSDHAIAGLPRVRVWVPGGVIIGHQLSRDGDKVVILTDEGRMRLRSDRIESANTRRTTVSRTKR